MQSVLFSFSRAHAQTLAQGMGPDEALGYAWRADLASREAKVCRDSLLAGMPGSPSLVQMNINGLTCPAEVPANLLGTPDEVEAREAVAQWHPRTLAYQFEQAKQKEFTAEESVTLREPSLGWGGGWNGHAILGYERVLREGIAGLRRHVQGHLDKAVRQGSDGAKIDWYRALLHVLAGMTQFVRNHVARAQELEERADEEETRQHYRAIAESCARIAEEGAKSFRDAVQLFWFIHVMDDTDSPGRIDHFLYPYYCLLSPDPRQRESLARPVLESLWGRFVACRSWNVCLAGQTADGQDATNQLTWLFLDLQAQFRREAPNLCVRFFKGSSPRLMERCVEVLSLGTGLPALYNDEVIIPALLDLGIPLEHARNYALNGCMQIDIQGMSHMGLEDGEVNLAKCLEFALHGGKSAVTGQQAGASTLPADQIRALPTLQAQLRKQIEHCTRLLTRCSNLFQKTVARASPHLYRSLFIEGCIEKGLDMKRGGPLYNHGQFLTEGVANVGDSLYTIDELVFKERRFTLPEFVQILDADWQGHETLRQQIADRLPKYGNDCEPVDRLTAQTLEGYFRFLRTLSTWRGSADGSGGRGIYSGGLSTFNRAPGYGKHLAATPDGRRNGETVADSCGPARGRDRQGPTAVLKSAARLPHHLAASGVCLNLKFSPPVFATPAGVNKIASLFGTYFDLGGQQLQVNVVNAATLRAAMEKPADHRDVIVRVGGFSARYVDLDRALQEDILARTEHMS